jgi:glutamine amidotransferase
VSRGRCSASTEAATIRQLHPDNPRLQLLSPGDRLIVSEPVTDLPGLWQEIEPSTAVTVRRGGVLEHRPFRPRPEGPPRVVRQFAGTADG